MLRRLIRGAIERILPRPKGPVVIAPPVAPVIVEPEMPAPKADSWRSSTDGHMRMLDSIVCQCGALKTKGHYWCQECRERLAKATGVG